MPFRSTPAAWGVSARALHWVGAALVLFLVIYGWWMTHMVERGARVGHYHVHSIVGAYFILLLTLRVLWRAIDAAPDPPATSKRWERRSATAGHAALYLLMVGAAATGWVLWSAFPRRVPIEIFGIPVPFLFAEPNPAIARRVEGPHKLFSYLLLIVIVVHVAAALRHHFLKRNDVLRRMLVGA